MADCADAGPDPAHHRRPSGPDAALRLSAGSLLTRVPGRARLASLMRRYQIIEAPSVLGLWPSGAQDAPRVLLEMGLGTGLGIEKTMRIEAPAYDPRRDDATGLLNPTGLLAYSQLLAREVWNMVEDGEVPIVLGGDCSILLGPALALRER